MWLRSLTVFLYFNCVFGIYISNLNETCLRCLCHVVGCNMSNRCSDGYCGPYRISRVYWVDAGKPTFAEDDPKRTESFEDCARDYYCSMRIVERYMTKFGKDCNNDGVTNCLDYMMIHYHGGGDCYPPLYLNNEGRTWLVRFQQCKF